MKNGRIYLKEKINYFLTETPSLLKLPALPPFLHKKVASFSFFPEDMTKSFSTIVIVYVTSKFTSHTTPMAKLCQARKCCGQLN